MGAAIEVTTSLIIHESNCQSGGEMNSQSQANTSISQTISTINYQKSPFSEETGGSTRKELSAKPSHCSGSQTWAGNFALLVFGKDWPALTNTLCFDTAWVGVARANLKNIPRIQRTHERYSVIHPVSSQWGEKPTEFSDLCHKQICYISAGFQIRRPC